MSAVAMLPTEAPRSGREALKQESGTGFLAPDINLNAPRYFVQLGWHMLSLNTPSIKNGILWRAEIMPCRTAAVREHHACIAETMKIPGSEEAGHDGRIAWASYRKYAYNEAERILLEEASADRKNGLVELKSLYSDLGNRIYNMIDLNQLYFPGWPESLPVKHLDLLVELNTRLKWIENNPPDEVPQNQIGLVLPVLLDVGQELVQAIESTIRLQTDEITRTHLKMKLPRTDEGHKDRYDPRDFEILERTGMPRIDQADITSANALNLLAAKTVNGDSSMATILAEMQASREQTNKLIEQQTAMIQMLLAERQTVKPPEEPEKPEPKVPKIPKVS